MDASQTKVTTCFVVHYRGVLWNGPKTSRRGRASAGHFAITWKELSSSSKQSRHMFSSSLLTSDSCLFIQLCPVICWTNQLTVFLPSPRILQDIFLEMAGIHPLTNRICIYVQICDLLSKLHCSVSVINIHIVILSSLICILLLKI